MDSVDGTTESETAPAVTVTFTTVVWVNDPIEPCTVTGYVPAATLPATVRASDDVSVVPLSVAGVNTPVIPAGGFTSVKETAVVRLLRTMAMDEVPLAPAAIVRAAGVAEMVKFDAVTVSVYVAVAVPIPVALARTVMGYVPAGTVLPTFTVTWALVVAPVSCVGATVAVTPAGIPSTVTLTASEKPPPLVRVTVTVPLEPCTRVRLVGDAVTEIEPVGPEPSSPPHAIAARSAKADTARRAFTIFPPSTV
jgi:hypothetical protein